MTLTLTLCVRSEGWGRPTFFHFRRAGPCALTESEVPAYPIDISITLSAFDALECTNSSLKQEYCK